MLEFLRKCQKEYHKGTPIITDDEFDYLAEKYNFYEVGAEPSKNNKVKHIFPMYSLRKVFDDDEENPAKLFEKAITSPKLDGAAIELVYNEGHLISASTRGDGEEGDYIFDNITTLNSIPSNVPDTNLFQITGEVVGPKTIENARNYAAGALHLKDVDEFKSRDLTFVAYGLKGINGDTYSDDMYRLKRFGFNTVLSQDWSEFPQDGTVFREDSNKIFEELGYTSKHPRGSFAYKKRGDVEVKETKLLEVIWQPGKGGKITPVAIFETVNIEGANVSRATLHNVGFIEEMDLYIGDTLLVTRSGGVIPKVIGKL